MIYSLAVFINWGDNQTSELFATNASVVGTANETSFSHIYAVPGYWNVSVSFCNGFGCEFHDFMVGTDYPIVDIVLHFNQVGQFMLNSILRTMSQGSQMHCEFDYGDGQVVKTWEYAPEHGNVDLSHNYTTLSDNYISYTCWNFIDYFRFDSVIWVHAGITGFEILNMADGDVYDLGNRDFPLYWKFTSGDPVHVSVALPTQNYTLQDIYISYENKSGNTTLLNSILLPGDHKLVVNVGNSQTYFTIIYNITFDRALKDVNTAAHMIDDTYMATRSDFIIEYSHSDGSRPTVIWDYGDGNVEIYNNTDAIYGEYSRNLTYQYQTSGEYVLLLALIKKYLRKLTRSLKEVIFIKPTPYAIV